MTAVGRASRPYHQAMEVSLDDPVVFYAELADVEDPRVMLALRVHMEREQCSQPMKDNWEKRMKDVMCEYQSRQILLCLDSKVTGELRNKFKFNHKGAPLNPEAYDKHAATLTVVYGEQMIKEIISGQMNYPGITNAANAGMKKCLDESGETCRNARGCKSGTG